MYAGVFIDDAQYLVKRPDLSEDDLLKRWARAAQDALSLGLTSMHDAGFSPVSLDFFSRLFFLVLSKYLAWDCSVSLSCSPTFGQGKVTEQSYARVLMNINKLT